ncbi:MAG: hypothetical protein K9M02_14540 [Thiohalocapsa sp.]|jgi:hypothetical protein|nr:hypothetical protein [Thiohalocapsa sp.]
MKFCRECNTSVLPYAMVVLISGTIGFLTWLTLGLSEPPAMVRIGASIGVSLAVGATLTHYVISCMRRHCRHQERFARRSGPTRPGNLGSTSA